MGSRVKDKPVCTLCWASNPKVSGAKASAVIQRFGEHTTQLWPLSCNAKLLKTGGNEGDEEEVSFCTKCLSDLSSATDKGEQVAEVEEKVWALQREVVENLRILRALMDNYLARMSTLEGTIKRSAEVTPSPAPQSGRGRRGQVGGTKERSTKFRDGILTVVREMQRYRGDLSSKLLIGDKGPSSQPVVHLPADTIVEPKQEVILDSSPEDEADFMDYDDEPEAHSEDDDPEDGDNNDEPTFDSDGETRKKGAIPQCSICHKTFTRWTHARKHKLDIHQPRVPCPDCGKLIQRTRLKAHQAKQCSGKNPDNLKVTHKDRVRCAHCPRMVLPHRMDYHLEKQCGRQNCALCTDCQKMVPVRRMEYHKEHQCRRNQNCSSDTIANQTTAPSLPPETETVSENNDDDDKLKKKRAIPECPICHKQFTRWFAVKNHKMDIHDPRVQCPDCHKEFSPFRLKYHQKLCPVKNPNLPKHCCSVCQKAFVRRSDMIRHEQTHKTGIPCEYCQQMIKPHLMKHHLEERCQRESRVSCDLCSKMVIPQRMEYHKKHECAGTAASSFQTCPKCGQRFRNTLRLNRHIAVVHVKKETEKVFKCSRCDASFPSAAYLQKHQRAEHQKKYPTKPKQCKHCRKWLSSNGFAGHVRFHCKARPQEQLETEFCEGCGKTIRGRYVIKKHQAICPGLGKKGNFQCDFCGKGGFATEMYVKLHMKRHKISAMTAKPFLCVLCGRGFNTNGAWNRHKRKCDGSKKPRGPRSNMLKPLFPTTSPPKEDQSIMDQDSQSS